MNHFQVRLKIALFFCCYLIFPYNSCKAEFHEREDSQCRYELKYPSSSSCEIRVEALAFKTDILNVLNFEITGLTGFESEKSGIKPIIGTRLSYQEKICDSMDDLVKFLENDPRIEVLGFSKDLYQSDQAAKMFDHSGSLKEKLSAITIENLVRSHEDGICLENTLYLTQRILNLLEVNLSVSLQKATIRLDQGTSVQLTRGCFNLAQIPVPHGFFAFLPGLIFEGDYEPAFESTNEKLENPYIESGLQRSIVLVLRPFIYSGKSSLSHK